MKLPTLKILFAVMILFPAAEPLMGQQRFNIAVGLGNPELLNLGMNYEIGQSQFGVSAGFLPDSYDDYFSAGADYYYHFAGSSLIAPRRPWYGRIGLYHYAVSNEYEKWRYLFLVPRIGRDFNLSPKWGIAGDAGLSYILSQEEEAEYFVRALRRDISLSIGFRVFYRL